MKQEIIITGSSECVRACSIAMFMADQFTTKPNMGAVKTMLRSAEQEGWMMSIKKQTEEEIDFRICKKDTILKFAAIL